MISASAVGECSLRAGDDVELGALDVDLDEVGRRQPLGRHHGIEARGRDVADDEIAGIVVGGVLAVERGAGGVALARQEQRLLAVLRRRARR